MMRIINIFDCAFKKPDWDHTSIPPPVTSWKSSTCTKCITDSGRLSKFLNINLKPNILKDCYKQTETVDQKLPHTPVKIAGLMT